VCVTTYLGGAFADAINSAVGGVVSDVAGDVFGQVVGDAIGDVVGDVVGGAVSGAIAGTLGSVAGQAVGLAAGIQSQFSWSGVALAAISAGVGGGLGGAEILSGPGLLTSVERNITTGVLSQGVDLATGLQSKFDWNSVATSAFEGLAEGATQGLGPVGSGLAGDITGGAVRSAITGQSFGQSLVAELPNTIGQTVGNLIAGGIESQPQGQSAQNGPQNPLQALFGGIEHLGSAIIGGVEQVGGAIVNGVEAVGGAIVNGVETVASDVGHGLESVFNPPAPTPASALSINLNAGAPNGMYGGSLITISNNSGSLTKDQVEAVLFNESRGLSVPANNTSNVSLLQAEIQEGYTLVNRQDAGLPVGNRPFTAWDQIASSVQNDIINNPNGANAREYNTAVAATNAMTTFGGSTVDMTAGATAYNNRNNASLSVNRNITFSPVELQYGPFNSPAGPKYIDIYGTAPAKTNPVAPTIVKPRT
jgi:hypothetical protein